MSREVKDVISVIAAALLVTELFDDHDAAPPAPTEGDAPPDPVEPGEDR